MTERNAIDFEKTYANRYVSEMQKNQNLKLEILPNNDTQVVHLIGRSGLHTFPSDPRSQITIGLIDGDTLFGVVVLHPFLFTMESNNEDDDNREYCVYEIIAFCVDVQYRGNGYGRCLLDGVLLALAYPRNIVLTRPKEEKKGFYLESMRSLSMMEVPAATRTKLLLGSYDDDILVWENLLTCATAEKEFFWGQSSATTLFWSLSTDNYLSKRCPILFCDN